MSGILPNNLNFSTDYDCFKWHDSMLRRKVSLPESSVPLVQEKITIATAEVTIEECSAAMTAMKLFQTFTTAAVKVSTATCNIICEDDFACNSSDFGDNLQSGLEFDIDRMSFCDETSTSVSSYAFSKRSREDFDDTDSQSSYSNAVLL